MTARSITRMASVVLVGSLASGCALLAPLPPPTTVDERLAALPVDGLPLERPVQIFWNDHLVPMIEAETDGDAAFALGLVHVHLRIGQMEIYRRIARGRIAEMGGPLATDIDHGLRILNFGRAAPDIEATLPSATRTWLERFVAGVNHYQERAEALPLEHRILGFDREPWTVADVLAFGRLGGTDVNWLVWFNLLKLRGRDDWPQIWDRLVANGANSAPSFGRAGASSLAGILAGGPTRTGSNSLALAPERTTTGAAIMANDPHLGINIPNVWLIAGVRSPSYNAVGLMVPGLPIIAIGRNPRIAWGGTNMRAAASDLVDVSDLPESAFTARQETIRVRWWFDRDVTVRESPYGPVLSDAPQLVEHNPPRIALRWTGHQASDEVSAMLAVMRAGSFDEFRAAFQTFTVPGQNMLYADADGTIGQVMAVRLPARSPGAPGDMVTAPDASDEAWTTLKSAVDLPFSVNPDQGYLASANNRPAPTDIAIGYFFSPDDRVDRMGQVVKDAGRLSIDDVKRLHTDVYMASAVALRDRLLAKAQAAGLADTLDNRQRAALDVLTAWDGNYRADSPGPIAFEAVRHDVTAGLYAAALGREDWAAFANVGRIKTLLTEDLEAMSPETMAPLLRDALSTAAQALEDYPDWGSMHRLRLAHPLQFLPAIGGRFRFADLPTGGSTDTLMKTAHGATAERHAMRYGANARHISDLGDPDSNYFVLLGGQNGWFNSAAFLDQVPLWRESRYIQVPLRPETVRERFPHRTDLTP